MTQPPPPTPDEQATLSRLRASGQEALAELFDAHRDRLRRMVAWRIDPRLNGRLDPSDVVQETYFDAVRRLPDFLDGPTMPASLWLRLLTGQRLVELHRHHLGAKMRSAGQEANAPPQWAWASAPSFAAHLIGNLTSPSQAAGRAEAAARLTKALEEMDPIDREVLILRHFDELSNNEVAELLGLAKAAASNRYVRALKRLREILAETDGSSESGRLA